MHGGGCGERIGSRIIDACSMLVGSRGRSTGEKSGFRKQAFLIHGLI